MARDVIATPVPSQPSTATRPFYGWWIVLTCAVITFYGSGLFYYATSAYFTPIVNEFGWTRAAVSFAFSINSLVGVVVAPIVGVTFDRLGPRKLIVFGVALFGAGFIVMSRAQDYLVLCLAVAIISTGFNCGFPMTSMATVANWFIRRRALALAALMTGGGLGGVASPVLVWAINAYGWRATAAAVGIGAWVILTPLSMLIRHRPEQVGLRPDGDSADTPSTPGVPRAGAQVTRPEVHIPLRGAVRTSAFWIFSLLFCLTNASQSAVTIHAIPFMMSVGTSDQIGGVIVAALTAVSLLGRMSAGYLGDRISKLRLLGALVLMQSLGTVVFASITDTWMIVLFLVLFAPAYGGTIILRPAILAEVFGRRSIGSVQGVSMGFISLTGVIAPVFAGWVYDVSQSYRLAFLILAAVTALALPSLFALTRARRRLQPAV